MIVLDTHVWLWWANQDERLKPSWRLLIEESEQVGVSAISCFEVAWLAERGRVVLPSPLAAWFEKALACEDRLISTDAKLPQYAELAGRLID